MALGIKFHFAMWGLPSHEGSGLKSLGGEPRRGETGLPSHEGSGLKLKYNEKTGDCSRLPSHEGSGLKYILEPDL